MRVTILNGNPHAHDQAFEAYLGRLADALVASGHQVTALTLRDMDIRYCIGCFGCWVKTPGQCVAADESGQVCRAMINSDFTLWASPLIMGFPSALLKKTMDKSIPLIHPYFVVDHNEAHHRARYARYPLLGLLLAKGEDTHDEDIRIITDIFSRTALNLKSRLAFSALTDQPEEEIVRAIVTGPASSVRFDREVAPSAGTPITPPTRLTVFNGSPRGKKGNTPILLEQFLKGFADNPGHSYEIFHLNRLNEMERHRQAFREAECVLWGFPLYTDAMPGIVKAFIETLEPLRGRPGNPPIGFLVQSGFPEAAHSRYVERYLEKLADRLGSPYLGTIVKGGGEGVRMMPEQRTHTLFTALFQIGKTFGERGQFDPALLRDLAKPERYPAYSAPVFRLFAKTPMARSYWDNQLKANGVYEQRFAEPYAR